MEITKKGSEKLTKAEKLKILQEAQSLGIKFTHPYTPEENGHIESFHKTLGRALKSDEYCSLEALKQRLAKFYTTYNNYRSHGGIAGIPPAVFWGLYDLGHVDITIDHEKRTCKYELKVAPQNILDLDGINDRKYRAFRA